ncbi:thiamine diphosphokinase [Aquihabitans sp. McL0605]|uniref:thiamine diphosphokinase n=1 Tax=Aquihabitans sp. McL0605 TaxID=3415671 RepID=UPI003CF58BFC
MLLAIGGDPAAPVRLPGALPPGSVVVAADSGLDRLVAAGITAHHVVGDLDSVTADALRHAEAAGATIHRHPADKDATDIELALRLISERLAPDALLHDLLVVGSGGGRLDHLLADVLALTAPDLSHLRVTALLGAATVSVVRPGEERVLTGTPGEQVSLLPAHGPARGVTTEGLRWALTGADLVAGTTRAMSNELVERTAVVQVGDGVLAAIQPATIAPPIDPRTTPYDPTPRAPEGTL